MFLYSIPNQGPLFADELQDADLHIPVSVVVRLGEMAADRFVLIELKDIPQVVNNTILN